MSTTANAWSIELSSRLIGIYALDALIDGFFSKRRQASHLHKSRFPLDIFRILLHLSQVDLFLPPLLEYCLARNKAAKAKRVIAVSSKLPNCVTIFAVCSIPPCYLPSEDILDYFNEKTDSWSLWGASYLHIAAKSARKDVVLTLLDKLPLDSETSDGRNVLTIACQNGNLGCVEAVVEWIEKVKNSRTHHSEVTRAVKSKLKFGPEFRHHPLIQKSIISAAEKSAPDIVRILVDFELRNSFLNPDSTAKALAVATRNCNTEIATKLFEALEKIKNDPLIHEIARSDWFEKTFTLACSVGATDIARLFINSGFDLREYNNAFQVACDQDHVEIVKLLLNNKNVDLKKLNGFNWSPAILDLLLPHDVILPDYPFHPLVSYYNNTCVEGVLTLFRHRQQQVIPIIPQTLSLSKDPPQYMKDENVANQHVTIIKHFLNFLPPPYTLYSPNEVNVVVYEHVLFLSAKVSELILLAGKFAPSSLFYGIPAPILCSILDFANLALNFIAPEKRTEISNLRPYFHLGIILGLPRFVKLLFKEKDPLEIFGSDEFSPLKWATLFNRTEFVELFLSKISQIPEQEIPALSNYFHIAMTQNCVSLAKVLIKHGADINSQQQTLTQLFVACKNQDVDKVRLLLELKASPDALSSSDCLTPIMVAAESGNAAIIKLLLEAKANCQISTIQHDSVLHFAARGGSVECVKLLVAQNSEQTENFNGEMPFHIAAQKDHEEIINIFLNSETFKCLDSELRSLIFSSMDNSQILNTAYEKEFLFHVDSAGKTLLHYACEKGNLNLVQMIIEACYHLSPEINVLEIEDKEGSTVLMIACESNREEIVNWLLEGNRPWEEEHIH